MPISKRKIDLLGFVCSQCQYEHKANKILKTQSKANPKLNLKARADFKVMAEAEFTCTLDLT